MKESLSRRSFIAGGAGAMALGALALAGCSTGSGNGGADVANVKWDKETDVVIVGFGGAGASAAINASEAGANVIILEKAPEGQEGGNTSVSGGGSVLADPDNLDTAFKFIRYQTPDLIPDEEIQGFIEETTSLVDWLNGHGAGVEPSFNPDAGGAMYANNEYSSGFPYMVSMGNGYSLFTFLKGVVESSPGVAIEYETSAKKLIFNPESKEVYGVVAAGPDGTEMNIKAKRGVVLACGGFENNHQMMNTFYPPTFPIFPCGTPYNTGDGIPMVGEVGAKLRGFSSIEWGCHCCKPASEEIGVALGFAWTDPEIWSNSIMVNSAGKRFVGENAPTTASMPGVMRTLHDKTQIPELAFSMDTLSYTNMPMFLICDQSKIDAGPMFNNCSKDAGNHWGSLRGLYTWSDDNQAEIQKGWITKADTLEELAQKLGIDSAGLVETVNTYNSGCASGADEFGRTVALTPVATGPFYGCELGIGIINTQGGPARDAAHHVLDYNDQPIPRLYSGGEFGSMYVWMYQGAGNVPESMGTRVAGTNVAAEEPWS